MTKTPTKKLSSRNRKSYCSPSRLKQKIALFHKLVQLKRKRSKHALGAKQLLVDTMSPQRATDGRGTLYKRKANAPATNAAVEFLEEVAVDLPGKKSASKKNMEQKKVLPKKLERLRKDFLTKHPNYKFSLNRLYRHLPAHMLTSRRQAYSHCLCEICTNVDLNLECLNRQLMTDERIDDRDAISERSLCEDVTLDCLNRKCNSWAYNGTNRANCDTRTKFGTNALWGLLVKSARWAT